MSGHALDSAKQFGADPVTTGEEVVLLSVAEHHGRYAFLNRNGSPAVFHLVGTGIALTLAFQHPAGYRRPA